VHTTALERQLSVTSTSSMFSAFCASAASSPSYFGTPARVEQLFQERTRVTDTLFFSKDMTKQKLLECRISIISDLTALCFLRETQNQRGSILSKTNGKAKKEAH